MPGIEGFDYDIVQSEQISIFARAREIATVTTEWAEDKFESGREKALPYIGGGALILAGMGVVAGEAQAQMPPASSLKKINALEQKWFKDCKKESAKFHMTLVGPKTITEMEKPVPYTFVAMSCTALKAAKMRVYNGDQSFTWRTNLKRGKLHEHEVNLEFPRYDHISEGGALAVALEARKKNESFRKAPWHWKHIRIPFDKRLIDDSNTVTQ